MCVELDQECKANAKALADMKIAFDAQSKALEEAKATIRALEQGKQAVPTAASAS